MMIKRNKKLIKGKLSKCPVIIPACHKKKMFDCFIIHSIKLMINNGFVVSFDSSGFDVVDSGPRLPSSPRTRNPDEDGIDENAPVPGGGLGRTPTFKEYGETIKALEQENFQLKVRIHLHETRFKKTSSGGGKCLLRTDTDIFTRVVP